MTVYTPYMYSEHMPHMYYLLGTAQRLSSLTPKLQQGLLGNAHISVQQGTDHHPGREGGNLVIPLITRITIEKVKSPPHFSL